MNKTAAWRYPLWFLFGAACFFISQPLIRIPILNCLQTNANFVLFYSLHPLLTGILIALSAGVAEESFRFLFKWLLIRPPKSRISQPIVFGLGHGIMEACYLLVPVLIAGYPLSQLGAAFYERAVAITLHVILTIIVWNGFQTNRRWRCLFLAILLHGIVDASIVFFQLFRLSVFETEAAFTGMILLLLIYAIYSKKYYIPRRIYDEKI